ncbi:MAG TPA: hypothetical protein VEP48_01940 [Methylomirabilota bacterium]|nr:hypothetical protein [Methylomirabilota bacterium]
MFALSRGDCAVVLSTSLLLAACVSPASPSPPTAMIDAGRVVRIELSEFAFSPPQLILQAGETVTLSLTNVGKVEHEFMAGTNAMAGMGYRSDWLAKAKAKGAQIGAAEHMGLSVRIPAGTTAKLVLMVPPQNAQIEFGCFVEGHYEEGMRGVIVVAGAARQSAGPSDGPGSGSEAPTETAPPDGMEAH